MKTLMNTLHSLPTAVTAAVMLLANAAAQAGTVTGPDTAIVDAGTPADFWALSNAATLTVNPGGQTLYIVVANSTATVDGATVTGGTRNAIQTSGSTGVTNVTNSSLSSQASGFVVGAAALGTIRDSSVLSVNRGLSVSTASTLNAFNTQVSAASNGGTSFLDGGLGLAVVGGTATISAASRLVGADHGALLTPDAPNTGEAGRLSTLTVDASTLQGLAGSALVIGRTRINRPAMAVVELRNGSSLIGGNGAAVELRGASTAALTSADTDFTGGLWVTEGSALDATLVGGSVVGNLLASGQSDLRVAADGTQVSGNVRLQEVSTATLAFRNGAALVGSLEIGPSSVASMSLDGASMLGDVLGTGGAVDMGLTNGSTLTGQLTDVRQLSIGGNSAWNMTQNSTVDNLKIDSGQVNINGSTGAFRTLTLGTLAGAGTFAMTTDIANLQGDKIVVTGQSSGAHTLAVANTGREPQPGNTGLVLVNTAGGGPATFALSGGRVDAGTYVYNLAHEGDNWKLVRAGDPVTPVDPVDPVDPINPVDPVNPIDPVDPVDPVNPIDPVDPVTPVDPGGPIVTPSARAVIGMFNAAPTVWYGELATLRSRMGELRIGSGASGPWTRTFGGQANLSAGGGVQYKQRQHGISFGVDTPLPAGDDQWMVGVMAGYSRSELDLKAGTDGHVDSYFASLYSTWLGSSGYYVDAVLKTNRFENSSDVTMSDGQRTRGRYDNHAVGASIEAGKHIALPSDWFVEPFIQGSALWIQGQDYDLDNGMQGRSQTAHSWLGKVGTHVGRTLNLDGGGALQPYLKVAVSHEFANANRVRTNNDTFNNDLSGSRIELGAGLSAQLSENLQLHADYGYTVGRHMEIPAEVSVGVRYAW